MIDDTRESPLAEILCRPEGSALFFRKCGETCDLDAATQTELTISECRFEDESELPGGGNYVRLVNHFGPGFIDATAEPDLSEPERGDLPKKSGEVVALAATPLLVPSPTGHTQATAQPGTQPGTQPSARPTVHPGVHPVQTAESSGESDPMEDYPVTDYDAFNRMLWLCKSTTFI